MTHRFLDSLKRLCRQWVHSQPARATRRRGPRHVQLIVEALETRLSPSVSVAAGFNGLNVNDAGAGWTPPDPEMAVGPNYIVTVANSAMAIYNKSGTRISEQDLNSFYGGSPNVIDNGLVYDDTSSRFVIAGWSLGNTNYAWVAVSKTSNPTQGWWKYQINVTFPNEQVVDGSGAAGIGFSKDAYVMRLPLDVITGPSSPSSELIVLNKSKVLNGTLSFNKFNVTVPVHQPVRNHDSVAGGPFWFLDDGSSNTQFTLTKMTNVLSANPTFTQYTDASPNLIMQDPYSPGGSNDMRNGHLVTTGWNWETGIQWTDINMNTLTVYQQGTLPVAANGFSSIAIAPNGSIGLNYLVGPIGSNNTVNTPAAGMYVTGRNASDLPGTMQKPVFVASGTLSGRLGDFSNVAVDPSTGAFWADNENNSSWTTWLSNFTATAATPADSVLPAAWTSQDIGSPGQAGFAYTDGVTWTVRGGGSDIWGSSDQFNFTSQNYSGDATLVAKLTGLTNSDPWAKGGVMFRDGTAAGAMFVDMVATPGNGVAFQWRATTGGQCGSFSVSAPAPSSSTPVWVKLVRSGTSFTGWYSLDGVTWTQVGSATVSLPGTARGGLAVTAHNNSTSTLATFTNVGYIPDGWSSTDVGGPGVAGSSLFDGTTWSVHGSGGTDLYGTSSQFQFANKSFTGDGAVVAKVTSLEHVLFFTGKGGVMFSESTAANAAFAAVVVNPYYGVLFITRASTGAWTNSVNVTLADPVEKTPVWVKLERAGSSFTGWYSLDGSTWTQVGSAVTVNLPTTALAGLAVTSQDNSKLIGATFTNVVVSDSFAGGDIGNPGVAGSDSYNAFTNTWTVSGSGSDIWNTADQFHFTSKPVTGDYTTVTEVTGQTNTDSWAKAGLR